MRVFAFPFISTHTVIPNDLSGSVTPMLTVIERWLSASMMSVYPP